MDKVTKIDFTTGMQLLKQQYVKKLSAQISEFRRYAALLAQGFLPARDAQNLYRLSHNLTGSGLTFGFPEISEAAQALNQALGEYMNVDLADQNSQVLRRTHVSTQLQAFERVCRSVISDVEGAGQASQTILPARRAGFFVKKKDDVGSLADALHDLGYEAVYAHSMEGLQNLIKQDAAAFWVVYSGLTPRETFKMQDLKKTFDAVPFFIITSRDHFDARLAALRLGARGFSATGPDMRAFANHLDAQRHGAASSINASRILIVDDDDMLAAFYCHALHAADMTTVRAHSAKEAYEIMLAQPFDLAVINVDMPQCSGVELAQLMRQGATTRTTIPILFVTAHDNVFEQQEDSWIRKPFLPEDLITKVRESLKR